MIATRPLRIIATAFGLATLGSAALLFATSGQAQPPSPDVTKGERERKGADETVPRPLPEAGGASAGEERRAQAREEVASLNAYLEAKKAQLREAEFSLKVTQANLGNLDRQLERGIASKYVRMTGELSVVRAEADRETRAAELKDIEIRRDRAMRRMALIARGGVPGPVGLEMDATSLGARLSILERETDRLRREMDRTN